MIAIAVIALFVAVLIAVGGIAYALLQIGRAFDESMSLDAEDQGEQL